MELTRIAVIRAILCLMFMATFSHAAHACLGVSRTITISKFNSAMGEGPGGFIGLRNKEVVLTFDDGPIPATTSRILNALEKECTKATFFVVGHMARAYPTTLRSVAARGHTIAFHTNNHDNLQRSSLPAAQRNIIAGKKAVLKALGKYSGRTSKLFRYPYLSRNSKLDAIVKKVGMLPFSASILSNDWKSGSGTEMVNRVMAQLRRQGRGVILLHDIQPKTASALPQLLTRLKRGGYKVVNVRTGAGSSAPLIASAKPQKPKKRSIFKTRTTKEKKIDSVTTASVEKKEKPKVRRSFFKRSKPSSDSQAAKIQKQRRLASLQRSRDLIEKSQTKKSRRTLIERFSKPIAASADEKPTKGKKSSSKKKSASKKTSSKKKTASKKSSSKSKTTIKKSSSKDKPTKTAAKAKKPRRIVLFRGVTRQKEGESKAAYHERLRQRRLKLNRQQAAKNKN